MLTEDYPTLTEMTNAITTEVNNSANLDLDKSAINEIQTLSIVGSNLTLSNGGGTVVLPTPTEVDGSVTNEIQTLSISGQDISLSSGGGTVTIPSTVYTGTSPITVTGTTITHNTSGVTAGAYGSSTNIPVVTVDNKGHVTALSQVAVQGEATTFTGTTDIANTGTLPNLTLDIPAGAIENTELAPPSPTTAEQVKVWDGTAWIDRPASGINIVGSISGFFRTTPPSGYLALNGQTITNGATLYPILASVQPTWVSGADHYSP